MLMLCYKRLIFTTIPLEILLKMNKSPKTMMIEYFKRQSKFDSTENSGITLQ